jgi:hypothetical protein
MRVNGEVVLGRSESPEASARASAGGGVCDGSVAELDAVVRLLGRLDRDCTDSVRIDRIAVLERLQAAAFAAQAVEMARFADSQEAGQRRAGVPARRVGVGSRSRWRWRARCHR